MGKSAVLNKWKITFWFSAVAVAAYLIWNACRWEAATASYESRFMAAGQTGKAASESQKRIFLDNDACYWVGYAQEMAQTGKWRIRHTDFDNPPIGREVHWSQSVSWLLLFAGFIARLATGAPMASAIENSAIWIGPLQFFILIAGTGYLLFRRMGLMPALVWMINLLTILSIQWSFHSMRPDHHGLHLGFMLSGQLCLILGGLGWIRTCPEAGAAPRLIRPLAPPDERQARRLFVFSGILGGLGLWTGATVQFFGLGLSVASAIILVLSMPENLSKQPEDATTYQPSLWRWWAMAGAATSLLFYMIEYAPAFPGMRLEVNHPLYAVSWLCAGELLTRLSAAKQRGQPGSRLHLALLFCGMLLIPGCLFFGPAEWHAMRDPIMQRMHEFIDEFRPYLKTFESATLLNTLKHFGILPLFLVLAPWLAGQKRTAIHEWAALWMAVIPALAFAVLTLWQTRWMNFFAASCLLLAVITWPVLWRRHPQGGRRPAWLYFLIAAVAAQAVYFGSLQFRDIHFRDISRERVGELISPILQRQFAEKLGGMNTNRDFRIMAPPHLAARFHYYGGLPCVASYYWENLEGLKSAADFFAAGDDEEARRIVQERGITHVVLPPSANVVHALFFIKTGYYLPADVQNSMAGRMFARQEALPPWLKRDVSLERFLQPGFLFNGEPVFGSLLVFVVQQEQMHRKDRGPSIE